MNQQPVIVVKINGVLAAEFQALKSAPLTRLLLLICLLGEEVPTLG